MPLTVLHACDYNDVNNSGEYYRVSKDNIWLTKRITNSGEKIPASFPKKFELGVTHNPTELEDLMPILEDLGRNPHALIIRHEYKSEFITKQIVQRKAKFVNTIPSNIIALDIDDLDLPDHIHATDIAAQGQYVCHLLHKTKPEMFPDDMGFIAQGSSSAGLTKAIKLHLWICNYDKLDQLQLRNLFYHVNGTYKSIFQKSTNLVDPALYHEVQPHYTAYPIFENPNKDPFKDGNRTVYSYGNKSYVPSTYSPFVRPIETTEEERGTYLNSIEGGVIMSEELSMKWDMIRCWDPNRPGFRSAVISVYHSAIQDQYDLDVLSRLITPLIEVIRPGQASEYIRQGIVSAVNTIKSCSIRDLPKECLGLPLTTLSGGNLEKYLDLNHCVPENSVTFLKATLGTGKTHTIAEWLEKGLIPGKFLALTDTSALVESNAARFKAGDFRSSKERLEFATGRSTRLSGTLHSLLKIKELRFDFLFIDEADSLLNNLLFASIISEEKKAEIIEVLAHLLQTTNQVVISDGDISEETVAQYINLMQGSRELYRIEHKRQNLKGVTAYKHKKESSLWGALQGSLELGEKCLLVSDSSPDALNEYLVAFKRLFPYKNIKVIHSAAKMDEDVADIINNTTKALHRQEIDALLCSPSVTNGVDFNYFDSVFVLTTSENHTPNMRYQAMMREREPKTIHYFFKNLKSYCTGYNGLTLDEGFTAKARQAYAVRREREYKTYVATFNYYLIEAGARVVVIDDPYEGPIEAMDRAEYHAERVSAILCAKNGVMTPRHNDAYDVQQMVKYYYDLEELTWDDVSRFIEDKPHKRAEYLHKLFPNFWHVLKLNDEFALRDYLKAEGYKFYLATGESVRATSAKHILRKCGIETSVDEAIHYYRKYCEYTPGVLLPDILKLNTEDTLDV